jgi:hypothetical protein
VPQGTDRMVARVVRLRRRVDARRVLLLIGRGGFAPKTTWPLVVPRIRRQSDAGEGRALGAEPAL